MTSLSASFLGRAAAVLAALLLPGAALCAQTAPAWGIGPFLRPDAVNPVIKPDAAAFFNCPVAGKPVHWEATHTFNPAAIVKDGKVFVLYRAEDDSGSSIGRYTSRLGLAVSQDGLHFTPAASPVVYPDNDGQQANEWPGGCEDPRLVEGPDGTYILLYTQWNRRAPRLAAAVSRDLVHWEKHGPVFGRELDGRYAKDASKSGAILCRLKDGRLKAVKINGKYWLYWGEGSVRVACSDNLVDWAVLESAPGKPLELLAPRPGLPDSALAEAGPNAVLTERGIVFLYNAKNAGGSQADAQLASGVYTVEEALFDGSDPAKLLQRTDAPVFQPETPYEITGQYRQGTTFAEGLVFFQGKWFLYYGCADSMVSVAVCARDAVK